MLHNIEPHKYFCEFSPRKPFNQRDYLLLFNEEQLLLKQENGRLILPRPDDVPAIVQQELLYLFSIDDAAFFAAGMPPDYNAGDAFQYLNVHSLREFEPSWMAFAAITGHHLHFWYSHNRYCGACGTEFSHSATERALLCPSCGHLKYPEIAVAVIVGVHANDKLLLTKYADRPYNRYALVAGFVEIGETLEDAVRREVYEEVGLNVKNIHYFASQPWGFSHSLLAGFFAETDGATDITLDQRELAEATWTRREDINADASHISLTATMMTAFKEHGALI